MMKEEKEIFHLAVAEASWLEREKVGTLSNTGDTNHLDGWNDKI